MRFVIAAAVSCLSASALPENVWFGNHKLLRGSNVVERRLTDVSDPVRYGEREPVREDILPDEKSSQVKTSQVEVDKGFDTDAELAKILAADDSQGKVGGGEEFKAETNVDGDADVDVDVDVVVDSVTEATPVSKDLDVIQEELYRIINDADEDTQGGDVDEKADYQETDEVDPKVLTELNSILSGGVEDTSTVDTEEDETKEIEAEIDSILGTTDERKEFITPIDPKITSEDVVLATVDPEIMARVEKDMQEVEDAVREEKVPTEVDTESLPMDKEFKTDSVPKEPPEKTEEMKAFDKKLDLLMAGIGMGSEFGADLLNIGSGGQ